MITVLKVAGRIIQSGKAVFKSRISLFLKICAFVLVAFLLFSPQSTAQTPCENWVAKVVSVEGVVMVRRAGETEWRKADLNQALCRDDLVRVGIRSRAAISTRDNSLFRLDQKTTVAFPGVSREQPFLIKLFNGAVHFFSRTPGKLEVTTPFVNAAVGGTEFLIRVQEDQTFLHVFEGKVSAINDMGALSLSEGQSAVARPGEAPLLQVVLYPRDAIQWALYYPPILDYRPSDFEGNGSKDGWREMVQNSLRQYWRGDINGAFSSLADSPENIRDPRFFTYKAALLLSVGRVEEALPAIAEAFRLDPKNAHAMALQSIIALAQNRTQKAFQLASDAVIAAPQSAVPRVALSYAQQARFELESALDSLEVAVSLSPENELALARLAELRLSLGYLDKALEAARRAVVLNPWLARTQTVLGFANLTQIEIEDAKNAFERAILLDQADPWPRLGLGLAKIREGDLEEGRRQIEIAVILDPNSSLIRSYLGKAYFDEKRGELAKEQFAAAKRLDPNDPTPYFYDAIRNQTENRPVAALEDLQKSIELNDNRAVYRSRLQLDEDLAARSAALGRIYRDLDFEQLALVEGWKSVNTDPSNYSAHRLLADTYSSLPRHEIARVSELLKSQLLQPLNITPLQPSLAESNLLILEGAGPTDPSFLEFNPLFSRNRLALQASGVLGNNDTLGGEIVQSGLWGKVSYSLGAFSYDTDGFRENNDQDHELFNALVQVMPAYETSFLAEIRSSESDHGDLPIRFDLFFPNDRYKKKADSVRLGMRHAFSPKADFIATVIFKKNEERYFNSLKGTEIEVEDDGYMAEFQHLFRSERFNLISGISILRSDRTQELFIPQFAVSNKIRDTVYDKDVYVYSQFNFPENVNWTLGASINLFDGIVDKERFNPKMGVIWNPCPSTTLRAAAFRVLTRNLISDQTIEPTQVAGFNQYFDDIEGDDAWRYGAAIEQKFFHNLFGGLEFSKRDLEVPFPNDNGIAEADWQEKLSRAYLYWAPRDRLSISTEYRQENFDRDIQYSGTAHVHELTTEKYIVGLNYYFPVGFTTKFQAAYVDQKGEFTSDPYSLTTIKGDDHFWVIDALVSYRLPKRAGLISLEAKNLFDEEFHFQSMDRNSPEIFPERFVLLKMTLTF